ncbi:MAG TPA: hypothetical protein VMW56_02575, partial [Candidatus Margulisiibacteriota bacterium]|nr:hypothetical protein [Candidatus Margulisiibacteriota bacterium]
MTADQGRRLVSLCITCLEAADPQDGEDVLGGEMDQIRQLFNIDQSIVACGLDVIPAGASNVLRSHALRIAERCDGRTDVVGSIDFEMLGMIDIGSAQT